jgi:AraC family transcriptional regulator, regulatory protein of adaptative response / methylated-DNA-[protein]-cysteine methyltransferase
MNLTDRRWDAILSRNPSAEGRFFYAVTTTGVYCRPTCPSRRPLRDNVRLFDTAGAAEAAGFRACKRCEPAGDGLDARRAGLVANACRLIEESDENLDLTTVAAAVGMSPFHFHRVFKAATGLTPRAYADAHRGRQMRDALADSSSVTDAIYDAGYGSTARFYATAKQRLGMTPTRYREGGSEEVIRFAVGECSLGPILVAATDKGVCTIQFGDDPERLVHELEDRFPRAALVGGDSAFESVVARVVALVEHPADPVDLPLDIRGTAFQERVWNALLQVPAGTTTTYRELARRIGEPTAARAVAGACAANAVAVAIPCHRVVRTDGSLSGYRWGVDRKRALLDRETVAG